MPTPCARTMAALRGAGWTVERVEHWNPYAHVTLDLFGFADLLALAAGRILAVQVTTADHGANRRAKILAEHRARAWVQAGGSVELRTWALRPAGGSAAPASCGPRPSRT